jgi:putative endonuclease
MYTLYILKCSDKSLYTGIAKDLKNRLEAHRAGTGSKYVRAHLPFELMYTEECENRSIASKRESLVKKMKREMKLRLIKK